MIIIWYCKAGQKSALSENSLGKAVSVKTRRQRRTWGCLVIFYSWVFTICDSHSTEPAEICNMKMQIEYLLSTLLFMSFCLSASPQAQSRAVDTSEMPLSCLSHTKWPVSLSPFVISVEHREQRFWLKWTGRDLFCCSVRCDTVNWAESDITVSSFILFFMASPFRMHHRDKISSHVSPSCHTQVSGSVMRPHPRNRLWIYGISECEAFLHNGHEKHQTHNLYHLLALRNDTLSAPRSCVAYGAVRDLYCTVRVKCKESMHLTGLVKRNPFTLMLRPGADTWGRNSTEEVFISDT